MEWRRISIVMAGGSGERFWPVSTADKPKQFLRLAHPEKTLIEQSLERAQLLGEAYVATNRLFSQITSSVCGIDEANVFAEPDKRNTLGCLVWVAGSLMARFPDEVGRISLAVLTADQNITPTEAFLDCARLAMQAAEETGAIAVLGVTPTRPETGFGYIEAGDPNERVSHVIKFHEKPDQETAVKYLEKGGFTWNSGMFFLTLPTLLNELERQQPDAFAVANQIGRALLAGDLPAAHAAFSGLVSNSFDKAVMEGASNVMVVKADFEWDDLGSWDAFRRSTPADADGNVSVGPTRFLESNGNSVYVDGTAQTVSILGVEGLVVVVTPDHVMVLPESRAQEVKRLRNL